MTLDLNSSFTGSWKYALMAILSCIASAIYAQEPAKGDTLIIERQDTVLMTSYAARFNPKKALLYAAIVPGLGQVYNKKYWKLPLVYGGFGVIGWNIGRYHDFFMEYRDQYYYNLEHGLSDPADENPESGLTTQQLNSIVNKAQRERDFWIIMMGAMYLLQMVDAHVDAHLKEFDVNPNLRVSIQPTMEKSAVLGRQTGLSMTVKF